MIVYVIFFTLSVHVLLWIAHFEEVSVLSTSEGVVFVYWDEILLFERLFDVPEDVVWNGCKNLVLGGCLERVFISIFNVLDIVIFLTFLEDSKLFNEDLFEIFCLEYSIVLFKLLDHGKSEWFLLFFVHFDGLLLVFECLILSSKFLLISVVKKSFKLLVLDSVHNWAILIPWCTS